MVLARPKQIITPRCDRCGLLRREYIQANRRRLGVGWLHGACNCCGGCVDQQLEVTFSGVDTGLYAPCRYQSGGPGLDLWYYMDSLSMDGSYVTDEYFETATANRECNYRLRLGQIGSTEFGDCYNDAAFVEAEDFGVWKASEEELAGGMGESTGCPGGTIQDITTQHFSLLVTMSASTGKVTSVNVTISTLYFWNTDCDNAEMSCGGFSWVDTATGEDLGESVSNEITTGLDPADAYSTTGTALVEVYTP